MNSDFKDPLNQFNAAGIRYLIIGGYAVIFHANPVTRRTWIFGLKTRRPMPTPCLPH